MQPNDPALETRLQEAETEVAFLRRELGEFKDAVQALHARLEQAERAVRELQARARDQGAGSAGEAFDGAS